MAGRRHLQFTAGIDGGENDGQAVLSRGAPVTVCLETASRIHHHTVGPSTSRTLMVSSRQAHWPFPLDRQVHGSMRSPDVVQARLSFRVRSTRLELRVVAGCKELCTAARGCNEEQAARLDDLRVRRRAPLGRRAARRQ